MFAMDTFPAVQRRVEELQRETSEANGIYKAAKARIKSEFGVKTLDDARRLLEELKSERLDVLEKYNAEFEEFEQELKEAEES